LNDGRGRRPQDAKAAAFLLEHKADLGMLNTFLRPVYGPKQKDVLFEMSKCKPKIGYSIA
jgi:hypothetical protein